MTAWGPSPRLRRFAYRSSSTAFSLAGRPTCSSTSSRGTSSDSSCAAATSRCGSCLGASQARDAEIAVGSALMLLEDVGFYAKRSVSFRSLLGGEVTLGGVLRDIYIGDGGLVSELEVDREGTSHRIPAAGTGSCPRTPRRRSYPARRHGGHGCEARACRPAHPASLGAARQILRCRRGRIPDQPRRLRAASCTSASTICSRRPARSSLPSRATTR